MHISESMPWIHRVKFMDVKIPTLEALQGAKYMKTVKVMYMSLKIKEQNLYVGKKIFFNFLGVDFVAPKSGHRCEKQHVIGLGWQYQPKST